MTFTYADIDQVNFLGGTCTTVRDATTGFTYTYDAARLSAASVHTTAALPAQTCTLDANFNETNCTAATLSVDVTWAGQGPIQTDKNTTSSGGLYRSSSVQRQRGAVATGTFNGETATGDPFHTVFLDSTTKNITHTTKPLAITTAAGTASVTTRSSHSHQVGATADWVSDLTTTSTGFSQRESTAFLTVDLTATTPAPSLSSSTCLLSFDSSQAFSGASCTIADPSTTGFSYTFGSHLTTASVHALQLPAAQCTFDATFSIIGPCTPTTLSIDVTWTGHGATSKSVNTSAIPGGFHLNTTTTLRDSTATGTFNGAPATGSGTFQLSEQVQKIVTH